MKIVLSKLPSSGWWANGIPKYKDNPAMVEGAIPNIELLNKERKNLIASIVSTGIEVVELDFPGELDKYEQKHDFVFIRDPFISDQNGLAIILRAGEPQRRIENRLVKRCLEHLELEIVEMPDKAGMRADGGEFYFCKKDNVLFSGLKRNTNRGVEFVAERLNVNELVILEGEGFHLDTFFTPVLNKSGSICSVVACNALMTTESKNALYRFADNLDIPVFEIPPNDAIGTKSKVGSFATNALPLPGTLIHPSPFSNPDIDKRIMKMGIDVVINPTSQFQLSGGSVHCLTNEL
jgi:N-dimethylarginine dimethylaminohydrolase